MARADSNSPRSGAETCPPGKRQSEGPTLSPACAHKLALALLPPHGLGALWFAESAGLQGPGPC